MTVAAAAGVAPRTSRWRQARVWLLVVVALVVVALVAGPGGSGGPALDPRSTSGNGAKALVLLLEHFGATVELTSGLPAPGTDTAIILTDELADTRREALQGWVRSGGRLVVADPSSPLEVGAAQRGPDGLVTVSRVDGPCPAAGLDGVGRIDTGGSELLRTIPGAVGCLAPPGGGGVFLVQLDVGAGRAIGLGGAGVFTNARLGHDDNSVLAVQLLAPGPGAHVAVLLASPAGSGNRSLWSLIDPPTRLGLMQLLVAFAALVLWQIVRLGRPVPAVAAVQIAGSELVVAVGGLLARTGSRDSAAAALREATRRHLASWLGLGRRAGVAQVADAAAQRAGIPRQRVIDSLTPRPVDQDADLVRLAQTLERLRQEVGHVRR